MPKVGRPKKPEDQSLAPGISARFTPEERELVDRAVEKSGLRQSQWVRKALLHVASNDIMLT
jgi:uncharacterized protein (DUF1778 family)